LGYLHHEDFTGQYGKFWCIQNVPWYIEQKKEAENLALKLGFSKVAQAKGAVANKIRDFVIGGVLCLPCALQPIALILHWQLTVLIFVNLCLMVSDPNYQSKMDYVILLLSKILF
jgi:hypothetical protein